MAFLGAAEAEAGGAEGEAGDEVGAGGDVGADGGEAGAVEGEVQAAARAGADGEVGAAGSLSAAEGEAGKASAKAVVATGCSQGRSTGERSFNCLCSSEEAPTAGFRVPPGPTRAAEFAAMQGQQLHGVPG